MRSSFKLAKVPLCLLIGCSTLFGFLLADPQFSLKMWMIGCGVFILATGAASLNSLQEYRLDGEMERTKNRPLPKGLVSPRQAGGQAMILLVAGMVILITAANTIFLVLVAASAVVLYNGIYTPLKTKTVLAIVPGALCGAFPPYIGWLGGGGEALCYSAALLIVLFVLWQIPHYWLVLLSFKKDYAESRLPNLLGQFQESKLKRFFVTWIGALVSVMLMYMTLPFTFGPVFRAAIIFNGCLLLIVFTYELAIRENNNYRRLFMVLNGSLLLHMVIIVAGRIAG
jgi:protoheme IX farnesyltransferase